MTDDGETARQLTNVVPTQPEPIAVAVANAFHEDTPPAVAGYELGKLIGRGGMGLVWNAIELRFDRRVALKVHARGVEEDLEDLWQEALVAARIDDPSIVRVLDVGYTVDRRPYYAMELVDGTDLGVILKDGPMPTRRAVAVAADIARAASAAHGQGVIHRDLKPRNVIVDSTGRARVVDFGIAFDSRTGVDRYQGMIAGSPSYMSPEQACGFPVTPQTDIFSLGVILYEMLCGRRPFSGDTTEELMSAIARAEPTKPSERRPELHGDLDAVVMRCLARNPDERYPTALALFETLSAILEGAPIEVVAASLRGNPYVPKARSAERPSNRPQREQAKKHLSWSWKLASSPEALWPYVANTDRFNKAVGIAPVQFSEDGRSGEMRVLGLNIRWREFPFEWVKDREHSVFRWYESGPLAALWNRVSLTKLDGGGTELRHEIWVMPRGVVGQVAAFMELDRKLGPAVDRFYRKLDEILTSAVPTDPFEPQHEPTNEQRAAVSSACRTLETKGFSPRLVERLAFHVLTAPAGTVASLRPFELADTWAVDRNETLDALLHAAHAGLLEPVWDVICPQCMLAHESVFELAKVTRLGTCRACATEFERDLSDSVELAFMPHPDVRKVERATYCAGSPARRPHVIAQQVLDPGEERTLRVDLPRGTYRVAAATAGASWELVASAVGFQMKCTVRAHEDRIEGRPPVLRAGEVELLLVNDTEREETFRVEISTGRDDGVSATAALTHPTFRDLFGNQLLAIGERLRVSHLAFVCVQVGDRAGLFEELGDSDALSELSKLDERLQQTARAEEATMVPSSLDVLAAAFASPARALRAALSLRESLDATPLARPVAIAVHGGRCLALTREGKTEYFGETVHRGLALLRECPPRGVVLSAAFASDRATAVSIHEAGLESRVAKATSGPYEGRRITIVERRVTDA